MGIVVRRVTRGYRPAMVVRLATRTRANPHARARFTYREDAYYRYAEATWISPEEAAYPGGTRVGDVRRRRHGDSNWEMYKKGE